MSEGIFWRECSVGSCGRTIKALDTVDSPGFRSLEWTSSLRLGQLEGYVDAVEGRQVSTRRQ